LRKKENSSSDSPRPFVYPQSDGPLSCGSVSLEALARRWGTPLYVYSADQIIERLGLFQRAFADRDHMVCFAVKANSSLAILKLLAARGAGFDIVSGGELQRVLKAAPEAVSRVVFSGVGKTVAEIDLALEAGIFQFNVESAEELELLAKRARRMKRVARFALRVNPDVFAETHPYISTGLSEHKFGVSMKTALALYKSAVERLRTLVGQLHRAGVELKVIDAGGGLGIEYHSGKFDAASAVRKYAVAVKAALDGFEGKLLIEPGRFLVAQAGVLLTRVVRTKKNGKKSFVITDAAMNDLIRPALYQAYHEILPVRLRAGKSQTVDVVGPICETGDFFARDRKLPPLVENDLLAVLDAGAYGMTQSSNYNSRLRPPEVLVEKGKSRLIRRRETLEDLLQFEIV